MRILAFLLLLAAAPARAQVRVEVLGLKGELTASGRSLSKGDVVSELATFDLSDGGKAVLKVRAGVVLLKGPARFRPEPEGLALSWGGLLSVLRRGHEPWRVAMPTAVAAVRGTEFYVRQPRRGPAYLCLCRGALSILPVGESKAVPFELETETHSASRIDTKRGVLIRVPAGFEDHTDQEIASLKGLLGKD